jgi:hypothetical protein
MFLCPRLPPIHRRNDHDVLIAKMLLEQLR